jgi:hypothetical protein
VNPVKAEGAAVPPSAAEAMVSTAFTDLVFRVKPRESKAC